MASPALPAWIKKLKIPAWILAGLVALYTVSGFWILPHLIKSKLPEILKQKLNRTGSIQEVSINPLLFKVGLKGFEILQKTGGGRFVGFDELFIDFELSSVIKQAVAFDQIRLAGLFVEIDKFKDGSFNFDDLLLARDQKKPEPEEDSAPFPVWVTKLELQNGKIVYADQSRNSPFNAEISPITLSVADFQTYLDSGSQYQFKAEIESGGSVDWQGDFNITPLRSNGRIKLAGIKPILLWKYIQDRVNFEFTDGAFSLDAQYRLYPKDDALQIEVAEGAYVLENLKITQKGEPGPVVEIPRLALDGIALDLLGKKVSVASLASEQAIIHVWVRPDKEVNFVDLFAPVPDSQAVAPSPAPAAAAPDDSQWLITVNKIALNGYGFLFEDRSLATAAKLNFNPLDITVENFSSDLAGTLPFTIKAAINKTGYLDVAGGLGLKPVSTAVKLDLKLNLTDFQPYIDPVTKLQFSRGSAIVKGDVDFKLDQNSEPQIQFKGLASIDDFEGQDTIRHEKLLDWKALKFNGIDFNLNPMKVLIKEVIADQAYTRFIINPDATTNVSQVFGGDQPAQGAPKKPAAAAGQNADNAPEAQVQIDTVTIKNASANFADLSLKPKFATGMESLNGVIQGFSTDQKSRAKINLKGKADETAPVRINGAVQIFDPGIDTDIGLDFKNLSLTSLTPYSGKFAGYKIKKGKMAVNLKYQIKQKKLTAENKIVIKQLTLGDEVESPDAVSLPLSLAIALLQDANGVINIDLPLSGSLDDPEFSIWGLIGDVFVNLITKVVTSPFAALGGLTGGDEDLNQVGFAPGQSEIQAENQEKLAEIAKALAERPALNIEIEGVANERDAEQHFRNKILNPKKSAPEQQQPEEPNQQAAADTGSALTDEEFRRHLLQSYYMQITGMRHLLLTAPMIDQQLNSEEVLESARSKVYGTMLSDDPVLRELAQARSRTIRQFLIAQGLSEDRIFIVDVNLESNEKSDPDSEQVVVSKLSLTAN